MLVIGASGQLGSDIVKALDGRETIGVDHAMVDIENADEVAAMLAHVRPSLVINTAAYHEVERCETHVNRAFGVNTIAVANLASLCESARSAIAHISTDYVFDGGATEPYEVDQPARPLNVYGLSKYAGELAINIRTKQMFIFRTSGLYGIRGSSTKGHTFVERIRAQARAGKPLKIVTDLMSTPSYTVDVASGIRSVLQKGVFGTYHVTSEGACTWFDFAREILRQSSLETSLEPTTSDQFPGLAKRPRYTVLGNKSLVGLGIRPLPVWNDGLRRYLEASNATSRQA